MRENLGLFLAKRAALGPDLEALIEIERGRRFLYSELNARANRIATPFWKRAYGLAIGWRC